MELYLNIALGITLGHLGKMLVDFIEGKWWVWRNPNHKSLFKIWQEDLDSDSDLLEK